MKSRSLRGSSGRGLLGQGLAQAFVLGILFVPRGLVAQQTVTPAQPLQPAASAETGSSTPSRSTALEFRTNSGFPNFLGAYESPWVPGPPLNNSERLQRLMQGGKLELSLEDAIDLTLENNLDIAYARYQLPLAAADYLRTKSGGAVRGVQGAFISNALFAGAIGGSSGAGGGGGTGNTGGFSGGGGASNLGSAGCCDPFAGFSVGFNQRATPLNSEVLTGIPVANSHNASVNTFFGQGFLTGTSYVIAVDGTRQTSNGSFLLFNPEVPSFAGITVSQPLLKGFGYRANAASLRIAKNDLKVSDSVFRQQVITTVATVVNLYSDLLYYRDNVRVAQEAVNYAQKLLADNKRQVEIGTLAPIEVVRAESELATDEQNLIVAQTSYQQQQELIKTAIAKHVNADLAGVQIDATDKLPEPAENDIPPLEAALAEAARNRPEVEQAGLNIRNAEYTIQSTRSGLLPQLNVFATYAASGLGGNRLVCPANYTPAGGQCVAQAPGNLTAPLAIQAGGLGQSLSQVLHGTYGDYSLGFSFVVPIRNRQAQADAATALLQERQLRTSLQRTRNQVEQDVRSAEIAVTQAKAQVNAAVKATVLARETMEAEQKKFQLGESTVFNVILTQRDLATAEGNEARARSTYAKALTQFRQATATILDQYHIQMADAREGQIRKAPNIPGAPEEAKPGQASASNP